MEIISNLFMDYGLFGFFILFFDVLGIWNLLLLPVCDDNEKCWHIKVWIFRFLWIVLFLCLGLIYLFE